MTADSRTFHYESSKGCCTNEYLLPTVRQVLATVVWPAGEKRLFDLGCGNGAVASELSTLGYGVTGVDPSDDGIRLAKVAHPQIRLELGSAYEDLAAKYGQFPVVLSLEVVEHVYDPRRYARCVRDQLQPGGLAILSTPYHSYFKNLVLALTNKMDQHFTALWDHGHIKFWSVKTLTLLLNEVGLQVERVHRVGRWAPLAKSMIVCARRPVA